MMNTKLLIEALKEIRALLEGPPGEPVARAKTRMDDAAKRGGLDGMVKDTLKRVNATTEKDKLDGIVKYVDELVAELTKIKEAAAKKAGAVD